MKNAFRFGYNRYLKEEDFIENLRFVQDNIDVIDEITLFVECSHYGYWPLNQQSEIANILKDRIKRYKEIGVGSVGLNVLCTIGHNDEAYSVFEKPTIQTMVGDDGVAAYSCLCVNTPEYLAYIRERYKVLATSAPDFIWIDDDFRILNHGVKNPCFCEKCIADFSQVKGKEYTRESLVEELKVNAQTQRDFDDFRIGLFSRLAVNIKEAVRAVSPSIKLGFMSTVGSLTETSKWVQDFEAQMLRPGGGFYKDDSPLEVLRKAFYSGVQTATVSANIQDVQYELENYPYQEFEKSQTMFATECAMGLMNGCNGVLYNAMGGLDGLANTILERERDNGFTSTIRAYNGQWKALVSCLENTHNAGIYRDWRACFQFSQIGLPLATDKKYGDLQMLCGEEEAEKCSDEELLAMLSKPLFMDGGAFQVLEKRGFGKYCGIKTSGVYLNGMIEEYLPHELNEGIVGYIKNAQTGFFYKDYPSYTYSLDKDCEALSVLKTFLGEEKGVCTTVYKNELGGKVCVMGYFVFESFKTRQRRDQLHNIFNYLCDGLSARVYANQRIHLICRENTEKKVLMVTNCCLDVCDECTVFVKGKYTTVSYINKDGVFEPIQGTLYENGMTKIVCHKTLLPWQYTLLVCEK